MVVSPVDLAGPLLARGHRDREIDHRIGFQQLARQAWSCRRPKARTAPASSPGARSSRALGQRPSPSAAPLAGERRGVRGGNGSPACPHYSRFCTCSRNCSTTLLSSRPILVSSTSFDLAQSVLASRLSSWARKSSRRPIEPPCRDQLADLRHMGRQPVELLADVGLAGDQDRLLVQPVGIEAAGGLEQESPPARRCAP